MSILPMKKLTAETVNPGVLVLYSIPKAGKTEALAGLPGNLILDFEKGTKSLDALKMYIKGIIPKQETPEQYQARVTAKHPYFYLQEVISALKENNPYKYLSMDTITSYEHMCEYSATVKYMRTIMGKNFNRYDEEDFRLSGGKVTIGQVKPREQWSNIIDLPRGAGYKWLREEVENYIQQLKEFNLPIILSAHVKLSTITDKIGKDVEAKDLNLTGKIKDMVAAEIADSIGYLYREGNKCFVSFVPDDVVKCGSRSKHLNGKTILLSELIEDGSPNGKIITHWDKIYI